MSTKEDSSDWWDNFSIIEKRLYTWVHFPKIRYSKLLTPDEIMEIYIKEKKINE